MSKKKIAFQGEPGANSHLAITEAYPGAEAIPCATFEDSFAAVRTGRADLAMIPIENSIAGRVADIHHLMPTSKLHIVDEHFMPVHHQLLAVKGASLKTLGSRRRHTRLDRHQARGEDLRASCAGAEHRGREAQHHPLRRAVAH
jgi:prephenate dehydratase